MASNREAPVMGPEVVREIYRRALELTPGTSAAFTFAAEGVGELTIFVRNTSGGLVEASCKDGRACAELERLVGFSVVQSVTEVSRDGREHLALPRWCVRDGGPCGSVFSGAATSLSLIGTRAVAVRTVRVGLRRSRCPGCTRSLRLRARSLR